MTEDGGEDFGVRWSDLMPSGVSDSGSMSDPDPSETGAAAPATATDAVTHLELVRVIERVHRRYFDLLRVELTRLGVDDISPSQVMLLFTIGEDELSVRDLLERGHYLGSNASYNLKQLLEANYIVRAASARDRRSARIRLDAKGRNLCNLIRSVDETYHRLVARDAEETRELGIAFAMLRRLEFVWTNALRYGNG
ncbi:MULTISPECIES: MarR family transcriptional regulator [Azorhizobium]|uniref:MarR family transcriptional regulator n=1 Tax=Azorhizobium TaxID=6 RepID=UPI001FE0692B|nr:MarR family transcriptional regulator [Azorhizobium sp. AG788]